MEKEIAKFLVSSFLTDSDRKVVDDFSYDIGVVLDGEQGIKLPKSQRQKIANALEKIFEDVSENGTASINEIIPLAEISLSERQKEILDVIGEYSINDLDKEATMSSIFGTPTMEEDSFAQQVRLGEIDFDEIKDDEFKLGEMKFNESEVENKLFYGNSDVGDVIIYSDLGEDFYTSNIVDSDKYNFLISKGFTKINVGEVQSIGQGIYGTIIDANEFRNKKEKFLTGEYSQLTADEAKERIEMAEKKIAKLKEEKESFDSDKLYEDLDKLLENLVGRLKSKMDELEGVSVKDIIANKESELYSMLTGELDIPELDKQLPIIRSANLDDESKKVVREANNIIKDINKIPFEREKTRKISIEEVPKIERDIRIQEDIIRELRMISGGELDRIKEELKTQLSNHRQLLELSKEEGLKIMKKEENQKYATNPLFNYYMVIGLIQKDKVVEEIDFLLRRPNMPDRTRVVPVAGAGMKNIPKDGVEFRREIPRDLLMEIEEVVGEITSNYDSLKNEFEQGVN